MQQVDYISDFVSALSRGKYPPEKPILEHMGIVIRQWCRKHKYEITWFSLDGKIGDENALYHKIYRQLVDDIISKVVKIGSYADYKKHVVFIAEGLMREGFLCFNGLLIDGCNSAWKRVEIMLRMYTTVWLNNRGVSFGNSDNVLHHQALITLYEKISQKKLIFADSCELKSYYFRILENKSREEHRKVLKSQRFTDIIPELHDEDLLNGPDERIACVKEQIERLDGMEKQILLAYYVQEKKLAEIAGELQISAENCRVIKHRAMRRLINLFADKKNCNH
ncbi:MAG: sigma-70 family RNA polymerase sigma factor [Bacteroidales bacterium]